jgi:probable HAF family extracellular repeat protein
MHAFRTQPNAPINPATDDLGTLGGDESGADGIDAGGQVVGWSMTSDGSEHAFLYDHRGMHDLNELIPAGTGWTLTEAGAIDNAGNIVGIGRFNGQPRGFLLTPSA